jgi:hypothetical protein
MQTETALANWNEVINDTFPEERLDYEVHLKYIRRLATMSANLSVASVLHPQITSGAVRDLKRKMQLLDLTGKSLADEVLLVKEDADYATASISWLPAKAYYSLYHLLSIIEYLLNVSIIDFFYSMRLRTNYKDIAFIDGIDAERTRTYFLKYYEASLNFYDCFNDFKNNLITQVA